jgi:uncharacterized protein YbjT (DUF2867 family)
LTRAGSLFLYQGDHLRLFIVGGSGRTGSQLLPQLLEAGHTAVVLARRPDSISLKHVRLQVVAGDVKQPASIAAALDGIDAAIVVLTPPSMRGVVDTFAVGARNVVTAMEQKGVRRLLFVTSGAVEDDPGMAWMFRFVIKPLMMSKVYADARCAEEIVRGSSLDWTLVRPPQLVDGPATGVYRVSPRFLPPGGAKLSRGDLAHFLAGEVTRNENVRGTPTLAY